MNKASFGFWAKFALRNSRAKFEQKRKFKFDRKYPLRSHKNKISLCA